MDQTRDSSANIIVFYDKLILGEYSKSFHALASPRSDGGEEGYYSNNYREFTFTKGGNSLMWLSVFGWHSAEEVYNSDLIISYTPAYGGTEQGIYVCSIFSDHDGAPYIGDGYPPFYSNKYGRGIFEPFHCNKSMLSSKNNGIYKITDKVNNIAPLIVYVKIQEQ